VRIQLYWTHPTTGQAQQPALETPIALGREFTLMPSIVDGERVSRIVIDHPQVAEYHALITDQEGQLLMTDQSGVGVKLNGKPVTVGRLLHSTQIQVGPVLLRVALPRGAASPPPKPIPPPPPPSLPEAASLAAGLASPGAGMVPQASQPNAIGPQGCDRKVGFLFQRRCGRTDPTHCPYCRGGQLEPDYDPFLREHSYYPDYGDYSNGNWGYSYYRRRHSFGYNPHTRGIDFNESDVASFEEEGDMDFENRLDAS